ncbi:GyrI-like domain-containing protein [Proteiniclasticum ruminis]|uniref:GyrI-like domain-containing protein n=1 Tax=Proteiniclasticum ruminis TaxID=398199 RepID=UPI0028B11983|nr:GyrI-like domain-containing protein [Proteiniclasticum ruminis]
MGGRPLCVQMMHVGPFDTEKDSIELMGKSLRKKGYEEDFSSGRMHHERYLSDIWKGFPAKWRTVLRHPVRAK